MEKVVLAIDPGSSKCGMALVERSNTGSTAVLWRSIVKKEQIEASLSEAAEIRPYSLVIVGSGTKSRDVVQAIRDCLPSTAILVIDEQDTTLQARERYWEHVPRKGWRRLLPATLQVPPEPIDDFVALILAERVLLA